MVAAEFEPAETRLSIEEAGGVVPVRCDVSKSHYNLTHAKETLHTTYAHSCAHTMRAAAAGVFMLEAHTRNLTHKLYITYSRAHAHTHTCTIVPARIAGGTVIVSCEGARPPRTTVPVNRFVFAAAANALILAPGDDSRLAVGDSKRALLPARWCAPGSGSGLSTSNRNNKI